MYNRYPVYMLKPHIYGMLYTKQPNHFLIGIQCYCPVCTNSSEWRYDNSMVTVVSVGISGYEQYTQSKDRRWKEGGGSREGGWEGGRQGGRKGGTCLVLMATLLTSCSSVSPSTRSASPPPVSPVFVLVMERVIGR